MRDARQTRGADRLVVGLLLFLVACGSTPSYRPEPGPYDLLPTPERVPLRGARLALESGDFARAAAYLEPVAERHPRNVALRAFLQDLELAQLRAGLPLKEVEPLVDSGDAEGVLRQRYVELARSEARPELWVLAARLEDDGGRALDYLDRALTLDPGCVWAYYARAWWSFRLRRFPDARTAMERALAIDPGHLPCMRLSAHMLAGSGDRPGAIHVLDLWLERAASDPLVPSVQRAEALVDLAYLYVLDDKPKRALALIDELENFDLEGRYLADWARLELVRAAAHDLRGDADLALAAARRAGERDPSLLLPLVDEALLIQRRFPRSDAEKAAWERVLEEASAPKNDEGTQVDFDRLLLRLMARVQLDRLENQEPRFVGLFANPQGAPGSEQGEAQ